MNIPLISSLFKVKSKELHVPDSMLVKKLKSLSAHSNLLIYSNVKIYHHTKSFHIPLLMLDDLRGLYIFEIKGWSYNDLKNATVEKAKHQETSKNTLSFDNTRDIIRTKFNELVHNDGVPVFNYLIMENLSADEYEHLDDSFKELLPLNKLIFNDSSESDIFKKLQNASQENYNLPSVNDILGTLLVQYTILDEENSLLLCSDEQTAFIDLELGAITHLNGLPRSGKSNVILLKSIFELLNNPSLKITIIKPTLLACDILKKKLLEMIEHAIIEIDLTSIEIITPIELVNRHLKQLNKEALSDQLSIDESLMRKSITASNILFCDDACFYNSTFVEYLVHLQKKSKLVLVNSKDSNEPLLLSESFQDVSREIHFYKTNPHAKTLHIISNLLTHAKPEDILVVANSLSLEKLRDDLDDFIECDISLIDSSQHLLNQDFDGIILATYEHINALSAKHIIILDLCFTNMYEIEYAFNLARLSVHIAYEEDCQEILTLRNKYESNEE